MIERPVIQVVFGVIRQHPVLLSLHGILRFADLKDVEHFKIVFEEIFIRLIEIEADQLHFISCRFELCGSARSVIPVAERFSLIGENRCLSL
ncbi:hypothetical protein D3C85_1400290 [compost metagenome]